MWPFSKTPVGWKYDLLDPEEGNVFLGKGGYGTAEQAFDAAATALSTDSRWSNDSTTLHTMGNARSFVLGTEAMTATLRATPDSILGTGPFIPVAVRLSYVK